MGITRDDMASIREKLIEKYGEENAKKVLAIIMDGYGSGLGKDDLTNAIQDQTSDIQSLDGEALSLIVAVIF